MKISKLLPIALAFTLCFSSAVYAEGEPTGAGDGLGGGADASASATNIYSLTLPEYLKITNTKEAGTSTVDYGANYESATIDTALSGQFTVISNKVTKDIYLQGTSVTSGGTANSLYSVAKDPSKMYLVFTNEDHKPANTSVTNITGGSATTAGNPDAVAFAITASSSHDLFTTDGITPAWDDAKNQAKYTIKNGTSVFTFNVSGTNDTNTFSTHDTNGTYKATLTMTETTL